jgi:hypothetical protein
MVSDVVFKRRNEALKGYLSFGVTLILCLRLSCVRTCGRRIVWWTKWRICLLSDIWHGLGRSSILHMLDSNCRTADCGSTFWLVLFTAKTKRRFS